MTKTTLQRASMLLLVAVLSMGAACGDDDGEATETGGQETTSTTAAAAVTTTPTTVAGTTTTAAAAGNRITIQNFTFMGIDSTESGDTWTVVNQDTVPHTVSAVDGSFRWAVAGGETETFTHELPPGSYPIRCDIHPSRMTGTLVVE